MITALPHLSVAMPVLATTLATPIPLEASLIELAGLTAEQQIRVLEALLPRLPGQEHDPGLVSHLQDTIVRLREGRLPGMEGSVLAMLHPNAEEIANILLELELLPSLSVAITPPAPMEAVRPIHPLVAAAAAGTMRPETTAADPTPKALVDYGLLLEKAAQLLISGGEVGELFLALEGAISAAVVYRCAFVDLFADAQLANRDHLTGLLNRRALEAEGPSLGQKVRGGQKRAATGQDYVLMIDIDHFKLVNDTYGHPIGDEVIRLVARTLQDNVRRNDSVGRWGGEEFVIIVRDTNETGVQTAAEKLLTAIRALSIKNPQGGEPLSVRVSIGAAPIVEDYEVGPFQKAVERADKALYARKRAGRDGFEMFS